MSISSKYKAATIENKWYQYWLDQGYFYSTPDEREPYTIVIPPPNVTGVLHMGHMLNNTIQDVLTRRARLKGYNACWVPGTDHASIATEAKVVAKLKAEGIKKTELTREAFIKHAWEWTNTHGGIILEQLKKLGCSCDWNRTKFTMDDKLSRSVTKTFVDLHKKGLIYRGHRMVNWDPEAQTTLSDEEVIYIEKQGHLYHIRYAIKDSSEYLVVATTRPETIFGDTAICVHPEDERYQRLIGQHVFVPIGGREIPIIADTYVDKDFGTGCLKITPAHDINDQKLGDKYHLAFIDIFNDDATLNSQGLHYEGKDRFEVRRSIVKELESQGALLKRETHLHKVGTSERTGAVIEPKMSVQWFLKMKDLAQPALEAITSSEVELVPHKFINTYRHWMENIRDWNISRQLWWGHRIPAYYYNDTDYVIAEDIEQALLLARQQSGDDGLQLNKLSQDTDVLDTWFSSWLWPMNVFDGILEPDNPDFKYYYPTNDLVTAPEIIFFWVARMIMAGYEFAGKKPFDKVYFTGIVRDKQRRKMSKSLGNSPDPLALIERYGADGVRVGMLLSSPAGNDLMFDEDLCKQGAAFANKIWNAFRLIDGWKIDENKSQNQAAAIGLKWFDYRLQQQLQRIERHYGQYRISDALMATYKLIWDDFCSWLLEIIKPPYEEAIDGQTYHSTINVLEKLLKLLHPFMPFISEEIWQQINERKPDEALIVASWPSQEDFEKTYLEQFDFVKEIITQIRAIRKQKNISNRTPLALVVIDSINTGKDFDSVIKKLCNLSEISYTTTYKSVDSISFRIKSNEYFIPVKQVDSEEQQQKLKEELSYNEGFLKSVRAKLSNEKFVSGAPQRVISIERQKEADTLAKIAIIKSSLGG